MIPSLGTIEVAIRFDKKGRVDHQRSLKACRKALDRYVKENQEAISVLEANEKIWNNRQGLRSMSVSTLVREILASIGKTIKKREALGDYETEVKNLLTCNKDRYYYIGRGSRKGIHRLDRYPEGEFEKVLGEV